MSTVKKKVAKKKVAKKKVAKKRVVKKAAPAKAVKAISAGYTKSQLYAHISEDTGLARRDVAKVFDSLSDVIEGHIKSRGAGE